MIFEGFEVNDINTGKVKSLSKLATMQRTVVRSQAGMANEQTENDSDYMSESITMSDSSTSTSGATTNTPQNDSSIGDVSVSPSRTNSCVSLQEWDD